MAPTLRRRETRPKTRVPRKPKRKTPRKKQPAVKPKNIKKAHVVVEDFTCNSSVTTSSHSHDHSSNNDSLDSEAVDDHTFTNGCSTPKAQAVDHISTNGCSTPKAKRYRIPEIVTCPPAPKKQRVVSNWPLQRRPIAFFAPPDLELFFFFALSD